MNKSFRSAKLQPPQHKINDQITAETVRVLNAAGENLGIMPISEARRLAQEKGVDIVQIAETPKETVVKLINFGKFKYQLDKREKKQKATEKKTELKVMRLSFAAKLHDLAIKAKQAEKFLNLGHQVQVEIILRGRQKAHQNIAQRRLQEFLSLFSVKYKLIHERKTPSGFQIIINKAS